MNGWKRIALVGMLAVAAFIATALLLRTPFIQHWFASPPGMLLLSGNIEAHESVLSFKTVQSRITQLPFDEGQWVKKGTPLAVLDDTDYVQQITIAEANLAVQERQLDATRQTFEAARKTIISDEADLAQKKLDYDRDRDLRSRGFVSAAVLDLATTAVKQATAALERDRALAAADERNIKVVQANIHDSQEALELARIVRGYTTLVSPFDGVVLVRQAELGEVAMPGTPILTLADLDHVWLRAYINETDISKVRLGQAVIVTTDSYPGKRYRGRISFISSQSEFTPKSVETHAERVTLVYRVKIDIDNPSHELVPGMPADARVQLLPAGPS